MNWDSIDIIIIQVKEKLSKSMLQIRKALSLSSHLESPHQATKDKRKIPR